MIAAHRKGDQVWFIVGPHFYEGVEWCARGDGTFMNPTYNGDVGPDGRPEDNRPLTGCLRLYCACIDD